MKLDIFIQQKLDLTFNHSFVATIIGEFMKMLNIFSRRARSRSSFKLKRSRFSNGGVISSYFFSFFFFSTTPRILPFPREPQTITTYCEFSRERQPLENSSVDLFPSFQMTDWNQTFLREILAKNSARWRYRMKIDDMKLPLKIFLLNSCYPHDTDWLVFIIKRTTDE